MTSGNASQAEEVFRTALRLDSRFTDAALCLASVWRQWAAWQDAEAILRDAVESDPAHVGAIYNLGYFLMERDAFAEAESLDAPCSQGRS